MATTMVMMAQSVPEVRSIRRARGARTETNIEEINERNLISLQHKMWACPNAAGPAAAARRQHDAACAAPTWT
eukprot:6358314-Prymnesium_polylepis.1